MSEEGEFKKRIEKMYGIKKGENPEDYNRIRELYRILRDAKRDFPNEVFEAIKDGILPHATSDRLQEWFKKWFGSVEK